MSKEIWKDVEGYEGLYQISNKGRLKSECRNGTLGGLVKPEKTNRGYIRYTLSKNNSSKRFAAHRLMAFAFLSNPENKPHVNHINGVKHDNTVENLEWCTHSENVKHSYDKLGAKRPTGENHGLSKLTEEHVRNIRLLYASGGLTHQMLSDYYGVAQSLIGLIIRRKRWRHVL